MTTQPKIIARRCFNKAQRQAIVHALQGITTLDEAKQVTIELHEHPISLLGFRKPKQAHNLYYYLTGLPLFPDSFGEYKRRNGYSFPPDYEKIIPQEADKAMRLYGHPGRAAALLKAQLETVQANNLGVPRFLYSVISELESRAQDKTWYSWRGRCEKAIWYKLDTKLANLGPPLTPIGINSTNQKGDTYGPQVAPP